MDWEVFHLMKPDQDTLNFLTKTRGLHPFIEQYSFLSILNSWYLLSFLLKNFIYKYS